MNSANKGKADEASKKKLKKEYEDRLDKLCGDKFKKEFLSWIKLSTAYKELKKEINEIIGNVNFDGLYESLELVGRKWSKLVMERTREGEFVWMSIQKDSWKKEDCIKGYINYLTTNSENLSAHGGKFNIESYVKELKKIKNKNETVYFVPHDELCLDLETVNMKLASTLKCMNEYEWKPEEPGKVKLSNYPDGLNLQEFILCLWSGVLGSEEISQIGLPEKLKNDLTLVGGVNESAQFLHHFEGYQRNCSLFHESLHHHYQRLSNYATETYEANIIANVASLCTIYECPQNIQTIWNNEPVFVFPQNFILEKNQ